MDMDGQTEPIQETSTVNDESRSGDEELMDKENIELEDGERFKLWLMTFRNDHKII